MRWVEANRGPGAPNFDLKEQGVRARSVIDAPVQGKGYFR
jgi:hypothetical protein